MKYQVQVTVIAQRQVEVEAPNDMQVEALAREQVRKEFGTADRVIVKEIDFAQEQAKAA